MGLSNASLILYINITILLLSCADEYSQFRAVDFKTRKEQSGTY